jgi:hypothetical protein
MSSEYQLYLCLILATRLFLLRRDNALSWRFALTITVAQLALVALAFGFSGQALPALAAVALFSGLAALGEHWLSPPWWRLMSVTGLALLPAACAPWSGPFALTPLAVAVANAVDPVGAALLGASRWQELDLLATLLALLVLANEVNVAIRVILIACGLVPLTAPATTDEREFNAGRVIGMLERWLMFIIIVYADDWGALGFIIAAKGLVRVRKLDDPIFAEYLLVGTLLSTLFAIVVAGWLG